MRHVDPDALPHAVEIEDDVRIPLRDGVTLSARIWRPRGSEEAPVPAVLEFIPYRKRDGTAARDALMHPYVAGHGYASVRVDLRGSGQSDGVLTDEYLEEELRDGEEVIAWLAAQPWCDGAVGMIGISWGGFNGLQIAARRPPALKAVITAASTDDRYTDDVHYMGGCLLGDNLSWAAVMFSYNSLPPYPDQYGPGWRDAWMARLEGSGLWLDTWLRHQAKDDYWRHGSICEDWNAVEVPVMAVSGWADGYTNSVFRLLAHLKGPRMGIVGPWSHKYPHIGEPGPAIGFLQECVRFWDRWLKGRDTGIDREPMLRAWLQDSAPAVTSYTVRPGHWVGEAEWPSPRVRDRVYHLAADQLVRPAERPERRQATRAVQSPLSVGLYAGKWCSYAAGPDLAHDQREEDGGSLTFTSAPLDEDIQVLGAPEVELEVSSDRPVALVAARLSDVRPDGEATRLTWGILNLTHRDGHADPRPLEPGEPVRVRVRLNDMGGTVPAGHRLRLSLSTSYWPMAWTPPHPVELTVRPSGSALRVPERTPRPEEDAAIAFGPPETAPPMEAEILRTGDHRWRVVRDLATDEKTLEVIKDDGRWRLPRAGVTQSHATTEWYSSRGNDVGSARGEVRQHRRLEAGGWAVRTETRTVLTCDAETFRLRAELDAYEADSRGDETRVFSRSWDARIPRHLV